MRGPIVPVGIGERVVQIQRKRTVSRAVVAVAAYMRACRTLSPFLISRGEDSPLFAYANSPYWASGFKESAAPMIQEEEESAQFKSNANAPQAEPALQSPPTSAYLTPVEDQHASE